MDTIFENNTNIFTNKHKREVPAAPVYVTGNALIDAMDLDELLARRDLASNPSTSKAYFKRKDALARDHAQKRTEEIIKQRRRKQAARRAAKAAVHGAIVSESSVGEMDLAGDNNDVNQNVQDHSGESVKVVSTGVTPVVNDNGFADSYSLAKFLERPVSIYDTTFAQGTAYNVAIKPWDLWSLNSSVRGKLSNFAYFRGTLHLKLAFSGTPFHYGRFMLSYQPFAAANNLLEAYDEMLAAVAPGADALEPYKCYLSQAPGVHYIDVKENEPVELELPFFAPKEQLRLYNNTTTVITNAVSYQDFEAMGELRIVTLNPIQIANDDHLAHVSLNVYAWCTDIHLTVPTGTDIDITAESLVSESDPKGEGESRPIYDSSLSIGERISGQLAKAGEYTEPGPVAKVAGAVESFGNSLSDVPILGGFARATAQVSGLVGKAATWFGLSKPLLLEKPTFVKNMPYQNGATFAGAETAYKLACDPKQELTIDQSLGGAGDKDCMAIKHISARESFLTTFTWSSDDVAMQDTIWNGNVTIAAATRTGNFNGGKVMQPTSMFFASMPFDFWRGTITYRFEFVASKFHRGKVLIKFDPNGSQQTLIDTSDSKLNQQTSIIVDLQTTQNVEFKVEWNNSRAWCTNPLFSGTSNFMQTNNQSTDPLENIYSMGFITVRPLNELVQPTVTSVVPVNVYVRCDDLEVAVPSSHALSELTRNYTVSESLVSESGVSEVPDVDTTDDTIVKTGATHEKAHLMHFGERIESFRACMKRYTGAYTYDETVTIAGPNTATIRGNIYPQLANPPGAGLVGKAIEENLFSYLRLAYVGMRGGMRYRTRYFTSSLTLAPDANNVSQHLNYYVKGSNLLHGPYTNSDNRMDVTAINSNALVRELVARWDGSVLFHLPSNGGVEIEVPYYSENVFQFAFDKQEGTGTFANTDVMVDYSGLWEIQYQIHGMTDDDVFSVVDSATAEDFTFLRFQGAPFFSNFF